MSSEKLNTALYEKIYADQGKYRDWLLAQSPEEILKHSYEYTVREDIVMALEYLDLSSPQAAALLASPSPLGDLFLMFEKLETNHMDTIRDCIERHANDLQKARLELPVYQYPAIYARENDELEQYRASHKENVACKEAIEAAISEHYADNCLGIGAVKQVVEQFGFDRTLYVLANTVRQMDWDGRISAENKNWAKTIPLFENPDTWGNDRNREFIVGQCNPGLTDIFLKQARREYLLTQPLSKEDIQREAHRILTRLQEAHEPNSPSRTHYMAQISPDFLLRASSKDQNKLFDMLPFRSLTFSGLNDRKGIFALIDKDENRNQPLRQRKPSVRGKLQAQLDAKPPKPTKKKEVER